MRRSRRRIPARSASAWWSATAAASPWRPEQHGACMRFLPDREDWRVAVVGLGFVGSCLAAALADRGLDVVGIDVDSRLIAELNGGHCRFREDELGDLLVRAMAAGRLRVTADYSAAGAADVVLITVGTPVRDDGSLAAEQLSPACAELSPHVRAGQLIVLKRT